MPTGNRFLEHTEAKIAYFTMEIGLRADIPSYSGGLGVLAGDTVKTCADLELPLVAVTLLYREGYVSQEIDQDGNQIDRAARWTPNERLELMPNQIVLSIGSERVTVRAWRYVVMGITGGEVPVYFLDADCRENSQAMRQISRRLYGGDGRLRLAQEIVLGIGGARLLHDMGFRSISTHHINEGHAALLTLELLRRHRLPLDVVWDPAAVWDFEAVRKMCVFTTHTPVAVGHDRFDYDLVLELLGGEMLETHDGMPLDTLRQAGGEDELNMTLLALNLSRYANGVAKKHSEISQQMFPSHKIRWVTNGVHSRTWTCESFYRLFDDHIAGWTEEPSLLRNAKAVPNEAIWDAHVRAKADLIGSIRRSLGVELQPDVLTIGFARRFTGYKRADLIFTDLERLKHLGRGRLQFVFSGKAHPKDEEGKAIIAKLNAISRELRDAVPLVFLPNYDMDLALLITSGVDLWLNTPQRPREASGTSGMKAAHNGVPNFSVLDGWWIEGHREGITGWAIGPQPTETGLEGYDDREDAFDLYDKLEKVILPTYYDDRDTWIDIMKNAISFNASVFNTQRMMKEYVTFAYFR